MAVPVFFCFEMGDWGWKVECLMVLFFEGVADWIGGLAIDWSIGLAVWRRELGKVGAMLLDWRVLQHTGALCC